MSLAQAVLEKSPALDESLVLRPLLAARFPPYTPMKQTLIHLFSMRIAELAVNVHRTLSFWTALCVLTGYMMGLRISITMV